ncbi:transporter substrate-binding domain-containing protein [Simiduia curdlanivorans]|uniref:Solute-binding protein family 3/N-terminal domain-containing protein n=1 Tax=Simiduia curdlanivorans TaxID=1492769 RepID=A0ABV8V1Q2_9GAMM|nr:transporter substrate-binding domain-containing protein [Simiduia curdlanivorans]MDN3637835.1 transporter substrate-binding domain-containing protein [Simiduia curdlanivorans]
MLNIFYLLFALAWSLSCQAQALTQPSAPINFSLMTIPVYIEENKTGPMYEAHQEIIEALSATFESAINTTISPPLRAQQNFIAGRAQALMPDFCDANVGVPNLHSVPFARVIRYILTPPNSPSISDYAALKGKKVGLVRGYAYDIEGKAGEGMELIWTTSQRQTVRMLNSGRLDAIVANLEEVAQIVKSEGGPMPSVDISHPVLDRSLCYVFHDNQLGRHLALEVSRQIIELRRQGKLAAYIGQNHIPDFHPGQAEVR